MDAGMFEIEQREDEIKLIRHKFSLLSKSQGGKLSLSQIEMRDDLVEDRLKDIDELDKQVKARIV